jgi:hypothetical protein
MSKRRVAVTVALLAIVALAIVIWHRKDRGSARTAQHAGEQDVTSGKQRVGGMPEDFATATRRIGGTVVLDEAPAPGATVRLLRDHGGPETSVKTDASGRFDLGAVVVGRYLIVAEVAHATGASKSIDLRNPNVDPPPEQVRLVAHACDAILHGVVHDASGGTIAKARVAQSGGQGGDFTTGPGVDSGDDGSYELCIPVGSNSVTVEADGYADTVTFVSAFGRVRRDFELIPEAVVAGRAVRADDGTPVANATVMLRAERATIDHPPHVYATSDADGKFRFRGAAAGPYQISATAPKLATAEEVPVMAEVAIPVENVQVSLAGALSISGHVIDQHKKPISGVRLYVMRAHQVGEARDATTQADGSFIIDSLTPGDYVVAAVDCVLPEASQQLTLEKTNLEGVTLEVTTLGSISGRVTRAGKAVEGANVAARLTTPPMSRLDYQHSGAYATSDAQGRFVLRGLIAGTFRVYAESKRVGAFTPGPEVTLANAEAKTGVEVEMNLAGGISGTVVDQANVPVSAVHLRFSLLHGTDYGEATTAEDGTFRAGALSGGGDYVYEVRASTATDIAYRSADGKRFPPIAVKDGDTQVSGVVIKIRYDRLTINGRVLTSGGSGAPDVSITVMRGQDYSGGWSGPSATTDESGVFTIRDLPAGSYSLRARAATVSKRIDNIAAGTKGVEIRLPALGTIDGTIAGFAKPPVVTAAGEEDVEYMMATPLRAVVSGTHYTISNVPAGKYRITAQSDDGYARADATVGAGKTMVPLENKGFGRVEGRVINESTKAPVADLRCSTEGMQSDTTDKSGAFRLERVPAGEGHVYCFGKTGFASAPVTVQLNGTAHVDLVAKSRDGFGGRGYAGLELESQLSEVVVKSVVARGPADRAGMKVGDVIKEIDGGEVDGDRSGADGVLTRIETRATGATAKLVIEREGKDQAIEIKIDPARTP